MGDDANARCDGLPDAQAEVELEREAAAWSELWNTSRGQPVHLIEERLRTTRSFGHDHPEADLNRALTARVLSDPHWLYKPPLDALGLAWRRRRVRSPLRTLGWLRRPRFAG